MRCYCCVLLHVLISVVCAELLLSGEGEKKVSAAAAACCC